jgi:hypothetical protein
MSKTGTAFVYCDWGQRSKQTALNLIKSITRQLVERRLAPPDGSQSRLDVEKFLEDKKTLMLEAYLSFLPSVVGNFERVFIVVDALDELDGVSYREAFVKALLSLSNVQLLVTSCDYLLKGSPRWKYN